MRAKQKILITVGVTLALVGVLLGVAVYPIFNGITLDYAELLMQKHHLLQMNENKKQMREFEKVSLQFEDEFLQVQKLFVDSETPIMFFRFLDQAALRFSLQVKKTPDNPTQKEGDSWPSLVVRMAGGGSYSNLLAFLQTIENAPYILEVQTLSITKSEHVTTDEQIEFTLSLKAFVRDFEI